MNLKPIKYSIVFNRKNRLNKDGKAAIIIRCYQNRTTKELPTGISIEPKYWDAKRKSIKKKHPHALI